MKKKVQKKKKISSCGEYITIGGVTYERMCDSSVELTIELRDDVIEILDKLIEDGKFVSRGDAVRTILREKLASLEKTT